MFASVSRLNLGITVGPIKPAHIKTILSGPFPFLLDYKLMPAQKITASALWRMRTVLKHHDRVRGIAFACDPEAAAGRVDKFFKAANCSFPVLESLVIHFTVGHPEIPETFLRGPDLSSLHLRRLELICASFSSISKFLSSTSPSLTNLLINIAPISSASTLLACLQGMSCLRSLDLSISSSSQPINYPPTSSHSIPKATVSLSRLTRFCYSGHSVLLNAIVAGISAPSLRDVSIEFHDLILLSHYAIPSIVVHFFRFFSEVEEDYHTLHLDFLEDTRMLEWDFRLSLFTHSESIGRCKPRFELGPCLSRSSETIIRMSDVLSTKLTTVEELRVTFGSMKPADEGTRIPWHDFYRKLPGVKTLRTEESKSSYFIARTLLNQEPNLPFFPSLEEIDLGTTPFYESQRISQLAAFQPFVNARQQVGCPVKVFFSQYLDLSRLS